MENEFQNLKYLNYTSGKFIEVYLATKQNLIGKYHQFSNNIIIINENTTTDTEI